MLTEVLSRHFPPERTYAIPTLTCSEVQSVFKGFRADSRHDDHIIEWDTVVRHSLYTR
jgi:hypothetical protein